MGSRICHDLRWSAVRQNQLVCGAHDRQAYARLWDAIDQHHLSPFAYYGIHDGLDLRDVPWKRGHGYDVDGLTNLLTATDIWARGVLAVPGTWAAKVEELRGLAGVALRPVRLGEFLEATGCELEDVYANGRTWSALCEAAGLAVAPAGPEEASLRRACGRLLHVDDAARIAAYRAFLARENAPQAGDMTERERRYELIREITRSRRRGPGWFRDGVDYVKNNKGKIAGRVFGKINSILSGLTGGGGGGGGD